MGIISDYLGQKYADIALYVHLRGLSVAEAKEKYKDCNIRIVKENEIDLILESFDNDRETINLEVSNDKIVDCWYE